MAPINQQIEDRIDDGYDLSIKFGSKDFFIPSTKILAYGNIDLDDIDDCDMIQHLNFDVDSFSGFPIPSNYNYETHSCENKKYYQTWDNEKIFRFKYAQLGKPEKIIIFKT